MVTYLSAGRQCLLAHGSGAIRQKIASKIPTSQARLSWTSNAEYANFVVLNAIKQTISFAALGFEELLSYVTAECSAFGRAAMQQRAYRQTIDGFLKCIHPGCCAHW
jgi:hypothetical protein